MVWLLPRIDYAASPVGHDATPVLLPGVIDRKYRIFYHLVLNKFDISFAWLRNPMEACNFFTASKFNIDAPLSQMVAACLNSTELSGFAWQILRIPHMKFT